MHAASAVAADSATLTATTGVLTVLSPRVHVTDLRLTAVEANAKARQLVVDELKSELTKALEKLDAALEEVIAVGSSVWE